MYSSLLNFDQDGMKEIIVICGDSPGWLEGRESWNKNIYILDSQNGDYKLTWQKNTSKDFYPDLYAMGKPEIIDIDQDNVDEIFFSGAIWGGTCMGSSVFSFLYSPKYSEIFYIEKREQFDSACENILTSTFTSPNIEKHKTFQDFLEKKL